ncbi:MAG: phosphoribosylformylglycinamidine synthase, partial [Clostridiales bacterium]|nr:phosphoribosylformylglycinamidine synthase [Clostridiales bacterium]
MVKRIFAEKKDGYDIEAREMLRDLTENLKIKGLRKVRVIARYDVEGISDAQYTAARKVIFSEPPVDYVYDEHMTFAEGERVFAAAYLPGQYDQRADFAAQCLQILTTGEKPVVRAARVVAVSGDVSDDDFRKIKDYCVNPVESREVSLEKPSRLEMTYEIPGDVEVISGFTAKTEAELSGMIRGLGLAMDAADIKFCQNYFAVGEKRDPTLTELRMIDTYWSDHCRHTTFLTRLDDVKIEDTTIKNVYKRYLTDRMYIYGGADRSVTLMDVATLAMKKLKKDGALAALDASEEINACSIKSEVDVDGKKEPWLIMFKNETHNHPTEIEPFGGAATCLGGAIRDPLSGRVYVYQAMRVTGSGDPRKSVGETLSGKLPQRKITTTAAAGYSAYGNQIGLATGMVNEIYDEGYTAKRMEIGAVIGAAPAENVIRERPAPGDIVILLGGRTGRDGCGGATGSSKAHTEESLSECGAEVQKGNPPEERKIQRLFRNPAVTRLIKRCNDFGAGGVSVAIGELADGIAIDLDAVPKKYKGLTGTELAISESQERMAVVVRAEDKETFIRLSEEENLEATAVAVVTEEKRLVMTWRGKIIVNISREFLDANGAEKTAAAYVPAIDRERGFFKPESVTDIKAKWLATLGGLNVCSQKGLAERFDASIGAASALMPFGGARQLTPEQVMAAKLPVLRGDTTTGTLMSYGFNPAISAWSPFHGAVYAVVESVAKIVAAGGNPSTIYLTFQEYFERLRDEPERWGKPLAALLGAYYAQTRLNIAAIGGKDSMSGSFLEIDVPPTLVSFAVNTVNVEKIVSGAFKKSGSKVALVRIMTDQDHLPDFAWLSEQYNKIYRLIQSGKVLSAYAVTGGGLCEAVSKMAFGNGIGFTFADLPPGDLFFPCYGSILLEFDGKAELGAVIGVTGGDTVSGRGFSLPLDELLEAWQAPLEKVFPTKTDEKASTAPKFAYTEKSAAAPLVKTPRPTVLIPVFPGTNCEYDTARAFENAGANAEIF